MSIYSLQTVDSSGALWSFTTLVFPNVCSLVLGEEFIMLCANLVQVPFATFLFSLVSNEESMLLCTKSK